MKNTLFVLVFGFVCQLESGDGSESEVRQQNEIWQTKKLKPVHYGSLDAKAVNLLFEDFISQYNKQYLSPAEKEKRLKIFSENLKDFDRLNDAERGTARYGVNQFADMTVEEFKQTMLTLRKDELPKTESRSSDELGLDGLKIPKNLDWREKGAVTPIKEQRYCGSCWAFSAVANLEGLYYIKHKKLETFSEQQLVDCDPLSKGCNGGWMSYAIEYVKQAGGLQSTPTYPYKARQGNCSADASLAVVKVKENIELPAKNEKKMAQAVFKHGPISVALDARAMRAYLDGIAHPPETMCGKDEDTLNHGVTLVGYGVQVVDTGNKKKTRLPYWIAKNSWGPRWGAKGYYYIYRGDGSCGISLYPSTAVIY
nr:PREDICTED: LOW QUALITY PROTEIN: putative cysteine proteinase CG12163 [Bemisia tabaci]